MKFYLINNVLHKETCKKCINALNCLTSYTEFASLEDCVKDESIKRACKCCQKQYAAEYDYYLETKKFDMISNYANQRCLDMGFGCNITDSGDIAIKTHVERWIISPCDINENGVFSCTLYHKNNVNYRKTEKCKSTQYPEYHVQFTRKSTVDEILMYISKHEQSKWGVKVENTSPAYCKLGENAYAH